MHMKVLITSNSFGSYSKEPQKLLENNGFEIVRNPYGRVMNEDEFSKTVEDADAIILSTDKLTRKVIDNARKLKIVARYGTGLDNVDTDYLKKKNIILTTAAGCNSSAVADYTIGLMIDVSRSISLLNSFSKKGQWKKKTGTDLWKSKVGIIGLGAVGKGVAQRLKGFECEIYGYDKYFDEKFCEVNKIKKASLETIYRECDFITLHIPALPQNNHLISKRELEMMKPNVVLINTARASLINDDDLFEALKRGIIFGAALDVHPNEPVIDSRFAELDNVVLTSHCAAVSIKAVNQMSLKVAKDIVDFVIKGVQV